MEIHSFLCEVDPLLRANRLPFLPNRFFVNTVQATRLVHLQRIMGFLVSVNQQFQKIRMILSSNISVGLQMINILLFDIFPHVQTTNGRKHRLCINIELIDA